VIARIGALVVAVALVVGALVVRSNRDAEEKRGPYRLTCASELAEACRALSSVDVNVTVEAAGMTADRLIALPAGADTGFDGWLAGGRWTAMVAEARRAVSAEPVTDAGKALGSTRVSVAVWRDRATVLRTKCGGTLTWKCIGDAAARGTWAANGGRSEWGLVKIALADPLSESAGLVGLAAATAGYIGADTFVPVDLGANDPYLAWLTGLAKAVPRPSPGIEPILTSGPSVADVYIGLDAEIRSVLRTAARQGDVEVVNLSPVFAVDAMLAGLATNPRKTPKGLDDAVRGAGWLESVTGAEPLPAAGALAGLRQLWKDTIR
jgi:hypothetical protein